MELPQNHPSVTTCHDMHEILNPLRKMGITYLHYKMNNKNGEQIALTTSIETYQIWLKKEYYKIAFGNADPKKYHDQILMCSTLPKNQQDMMDEVIRPFGKDHLLCIFKSHGDYFENFGFGADIENSKIINVYLNNLNFLMSFTSVFKEKANSIINKVKKHPLILPINNEPLDFMQSLSTNIKVINGLSPRQAECARLLVSGKTSAEIANVLGLSRRTVEYYVANTKDKFNCANKAELIAKLVSLGTL